MAKKRKEDANDEAGRKYFLWTDELDQMLVKCILALVELNKVDAKGKFAPGAHKDIERMMEEEIPGCGVKADPNIISRCKLLKSKFLAVHELKGLSGAGWCDVNKMVMLDETVYADYVKVLCCLSNLSS